MTFPGGFNFNNGRSGIGASNSNTVLGNNSLGDAAGNILNNVGIVLNTFNPPQDMKTMVYAPEVRIIIARNNKQYDVSKDIMRCTVIRKENAASTVIFTLANKSEKSGGSPRYNGLFHRMDRIVVFMKRVQWQQVFSGYLDTVPFANLYGGAADFKATCTIKRLMHTWWNPGLVASAKIFDQAKQPGVGLNPGDGQTSIDTGLGSLLRRLLIDVGGWSASNVHVQNFPLAFYEGLQQQLATDSAGNKAQVDKFKHLLLGDDISGGVGSYAGYVGSAGAPGPSGAGEPFYIAQIVAACDERGLGPRAIDLQNSQNVAEAGQIGQQDQQSAAAWAQAQQTAVNWNVQAKDADAAILGVACAMVETGGGATIRNLSNPLCIDSEKFPNDGPSFDNDSCGIFQQRNEGWGTVSQRMNPRQAAGMFFERLKGMDWANTDPGQAIYAVQHGSSVSAYDAAYPLAKQKVQAYRQAQQGATSIVAGIPGAGAISSVAGIAGINTNMVSGAATSVLTNPGAASSVVAGKPNPDSEGAVMTATQAIGTPYAMGGNGPGTFDCSGLMVWAYKSIGKYLPRTTGAMALLKNSDAAHIQRGDLIISPDGGHVSMYYGPGVQIEAPDVGQVVSFSPIRVNLNDASIVHVADNGGPNPAAPRVNPATAGAGTPIGTGDQFAGGGTTTGGGTGGGGPGTTNDIARNLFSYQFQYGMFATPVAEMYSTDHKEYITGQPLLQAVRAMAQAGLRNFASGADGSFIAYYPDEFGLDGKPATMQLEDIELKDVSVNLSDDNLTTHVYINGDYTHRGTLDPGQFNEQLGWLDTAGSVTVEHDWLFRRLAKVAPGDMDANLTGLQLMNRFGVRPYMETAMMAGSHELEFLLACKIFMLKWAAQYETSVAFTFMPELFPGMRIILKKHNLSVYVSEVTHNFDYEHGATTTAVIMAPAAANAQSQMAGTSGGIITQTELNMQAFAQGFPINLGA